MAKFYYGDIGTVLKVTTGVDFTALTDATCDLLVIRPGESSPVTWTGVIGTTAAEKAIGLVRYVFTGTEINTAGTYTVQALVKENDSTSNQWYGQTTSFTIHPRWS